MIKDLLKELGWTVYRFAKESGIPERSAYDIANRKRPDSTLSKLAVLWLTEKLGGSMGNKCGDCEKFEECLDVTTGGTLDEEERKVCAKLNACINFIGGAVCKNTKDLSRE